MAEAARLVRALPGVDTVAPSAEGSGFVSRGAKNMGAHIIGVDAEDELSDPIVQKPDRRGRLRGRRPAERRGRGSKWPKIWACGLAAVSG